MGKIIKEFKKRRLNKRGKIQLAIFMYIVYLIAFYILAKNGVIDKILDYIFIIY